MNNKIIPVTYYSVASVLYEKTRQELNIGGCILDIIIPEFYGSFSVFDEYNRLLGKSNSEGTISFRRADLQTEEARVWYDAAAYNSGEYKDIGNRIPEPGLCFSSFRKVFIQFDSAPSMEIDPDRVFNHITVLYLNTNLWDTSKKVLSYR